MRVIKKIDVSFISLVDRGANRKKLIFKSTSPGYSVFEKTLEIKKQIEEQKLVFCIVYSPEEIDTQGDIASADVIKDAAYNFMKCARTNNVDKQHDFIPDEGYVAESWILKETDPVFPEEPEGSWAVGIKVENDETWRMIREGELTGLSLAGLAVVEDSSTSGIEIEEKNNSTQNNTLIQETVNSEIEKNAGSCTPLNNEIPDEMNSLRGNLRVIESELGLIKERIEQLEKFTPLSRQIKSANESINDNIKIWT